MTPTNPVRSLVIASLSLAFVALACIARGQSAQLQFAMGVAQCPDSRVLVGLANGPMVEVDGQSIVYPASIVAGAKVDSVSCGRNYVAAVTTDDRLVIVDRSYRTTTFRPTVDGYATLKDAAVSDTRVAVTGTITKAGTAPVNKAWVVDPATGDSTAYTTGIAGAVAFDRGSFWWADSGRIASDYRPPIVTEGNPMAISARNLVTVGAARTGTTSRTTLHDGLEATMSAAQCAYVDSTGYEFACLRGQLLEVWVGAAKRASIALPVAPKGVAYDGTTALVALYSSGVARYRLEGSALVPAGFLPVAASPVPTVAATVTRTAGAVTPTPALDCTGCTLSAGNLRCGDCR